MNTLTTKRFNASNNRRVNATALKLQCNCGVIYSARLADIVRGWGKTCSKRCAAIKRKHNTPNATNLDGSNVSWGTKPQYRKPSKPKNWWLLDNEDDLHFNPSWDSHKDDY